MSDWLDSLPKGSPSNPVVVRFQQNGCYLVNGGIFLRNFRDYTFDGNGATFKQVTAPTTYPVLYDSDQPVPDYCGNTNLFGVAGASTPTPPIVWWFVGGCDITVENMTIQGPYSGSAGGGSAEQDSGIQISGVQRAMITNMKIENVDGDFVTVSGLWENGATTFADEPSTDVSITGNSFDGAGRQGVTLGYVDRVLVSRNTISNVPLTVFDVETDWSNSGYSDNIDITGNTVSRQTYAYLVAALTGSTIDSFAFTHNTMTDGAQIKVTFDPESLNNATISDNVATGVDGDSDYTMPAIFFEDLIDGTNAGPESNILVAGNTIPSSPWNHHDPVPGAATVWSGTQVSNLQVRDNSMHLTYAPGVPTTYNRVLPLQGTILGSQGTHGNGACGNSQGSEGTIYYATACQGAYTSPMRPQAAATPAN